MWGIKGLQIDINTEAMKKNKRTQYRMEAVIRLIPPQQRSRVLCVLPFAMATSAAAAKGGDWKLIGVLAFSMAMVGLLFPAK